MKSLKSQYQVMTYHHHHQKTKVNSYFLDKFVIFFFKFICKSLYFQNIVLRNVEKLKDDYRTNLEGWNKYLDTSKKEADEKLAKMLDLHKKNDS